MRGAREGPLLLEKWGSAYEIEPMFLFGSNDDDEPDSSGLKDFPTCWEHLQALKPLSRES